MSRTRRIYLARHGECVGAGALVGGSDPVLSERGRRQARALARKLSDHSDHSIDRIVRIVASGLARASETAAIISETLSRDSLSERALNETGARRRQAPACSVVAVEIDPRLNEISYGEWDGLRWDEIERRYPELAGRKLEDWRAVTPPGGESFADFHQRVRQAWKALAAAPNSPVLVVAHEAVNAVLTHLFREPDVEDRAPSTAEWNRILSFRQAPGTVKRIDGSGPG